MAFKRAAELRPQSEAPNITTDFLLGFCMAISLMMCFFRRSSLEQRGKCVCVLESVRRCCCCAADAGAADAGAAAAAAG